MNFLPETRLPQSAHDPAGAHQFAEWLTVSEAVTYCASNGLSRTPKTIRKWALRSHSDAEGADLKVRREDIENGFRWSIERESLDRKIAQERDFERRNQSELVQTGSHSSKPEQIGSVKRVTAGTHENETKPVRTGSDSTIPEKSEIADENVASNDDYDARLIEALKEHISKQDEQILFYREELRDRRTSTKALAEVIQAFRLNAENQSHRQSSSARHHDVRGYRQTEDGDSGPGTNAPDGV